MPGTEMPKPIDKDKQNKDSMQINAKMRGASASFLDGYIAIYHARLKECAEKGTKCWFLFDVETGAPYEVSEAYHTAFIKFIERIRPKLAEHSAYGRLIIPGTGGGTPEFKPANEFERIWKAQKDAYENKETAVTQKTAEYVLYKDMHTGKTVHMSDEEIANAKLHKVTAVLLSGEHCNLLCTSDEVAEVHNLFPIHRQV